MTAVLLTRAYHDGRGEEQFVQDLDLSGVGTGPFLRAVVLVDASGSPYSAGAPGSTGHDYSANVPTLPHVGANFAAGGPYASYSLVSNVVANPARANVEVQNTSGARIAVVRDDGTAPIGAAAANASVFALDGGSTAGAQGGSWSSQTFKGRLQIYAPSSTAQVAVMEE